MIKNLTGFKANADISRDMMQNTKPPQGSKKADQQKRGLEMKIVDR